MDPWGAADPEIAYGAVFESMAASDAYDVLVLVHDFPYKSMPAEVATANDVTAQLLAATRDRPHILPVYVSLTSGEPPPETKALLDEQGDGAPLLRGALEAFTAIAAAGPLGAGAGPPPGRRSVADRPGPRWARIGRRTDSGRSRRTAAPGGPGTGAATLGRSRSTRAWTSCAPRASR